MQRNLATKIQPKWESGLTTVRLKRDPPVYIYIYILLSLYFHYNSFIASNLEPILRNKI